MSKQLVANNNDAGLNRNACRSGASWCNERQVVVMGKAASITFQLGQIWSEIETGLGGNITGVSDHNPAKQTVKSD